MIPLDDVRWDAASRSDVRQVGLVKLTLYSDYQAKTIDREFYWSTVSLVYDWVPGTLNQWDGRLVNISPIARAFTHLPTFDEAPTIDGIEVEVDASPAGNTDLFNELLIDREIRGAMVEVASVLVDWGPDGAGYMNAFGPSTRHLVRWRGEVSRISVYDVEANRLTLVCDSPDPSLIWPRADNYQQADPRDFGKRYPVPLGRPKAVRAVSREVGWVTNLAQNLFADTTGPTAVSDTTGFPQTGTFQIQVGTEVISVEYLNETGLTILARGQNGTVAVAHGSGTSVLEVLGITRFVYSGFPSKGASLAYILSPNGEKQVIPSNFYTDNPGMRELDDGRELGVLSFSSTDFETMLQTLTQEVSQQPETTSNLVGIEEDRYRFSSWGGGTSANSINCENLVSTLDGAAQGVRLNYDSGGSNETAVLWLDASVIPDQTREIVRWRVAIDLRIESGNNNTTNLRYDALDMAGTTVINQPLRALPPRAGDVREIAASDWVTPPPGTTLADVVGTGPTTGARMQFYLDQSAGGDGGAQTESFIYARTSTLQVELVPLPVDSVTTTPTEVSGASKFGNGVRLVVDQRGVVARDSETDVPGLDFTSTAGWQQVNLFAFNDAGDHLQCIAGSQGYYGISRAITPVDWSLGGMVRLEMRMNEPEKANTIQTGDFQILLRFTSGVDAFTDIGFKTAALLDDEWTTLSFYNLEATHVATGASPVDWSAVGDVAIFVFALNTASAFRVRSMTFEPTLTVDQPDEAVRWIMDEMTDDLDGLTNFDFASWQDVRDELPTTTISMDARDGDETYGGLLARIGWEFRTNILPSDFGSDTLYKAYIWSRNGNPHWPDPTRTLTDVRRVVVEAKQTDEMPTSYTVLWDLESYRGPSAVEAYKGTLRYTETGQSSAEITQGEIDAAQAAIGRRPAQQMALIAQTTEASAIDTATYYIAEGLAQKRYRVSLQASISEAYGLEIGDIVEWTVPWGDPEPIKIWRVTEVVWAWNEPLIGLKLEEVEK